MDDRSWNVLNNITFKTQGYRKNFDLINENENIITEYNGTISELRIEKKLPPIIVGEYGFSVWNLSLAKTINVDLNKLIKAHKMENIYEELITLIDKKKFNIDDFDKILFIHGLVIHPDYRKIGITEEFVEFIYRDFYAKNIAIIALIKPIQDNPIDAEYYFELKTVKVRKTLGVFDEYDTISAMEYYSLDKLMEKKDTEMNEYKLYSVAKRCGFDRLNESHLFIFSPEIILDRIKKKQRITNKIDENV